MGGKLVDHAFGSDSKCVCGLLGLRDDTDNTPTLTKWNNTTQTATITGHELKKDGKWNTLCLPFDLATEGTPLDGAQLKTLETATFNTRTGTLTLNFSDAETIEAGKPYFVRWDDTGQNVTNSVFKGVTFKSLSAQDVSPSNIVKFSGTYAPVSLKAGDKALYLDDNDNLRLPDSDTTVGAFHSWFQTNTASLGDVNSDEMATVVDVTMLVDHVLGKEDINFVIGNADINGDEVVSVADVTELVDIILNGGYNVKNVVVNGLE